MLFYFAVAVFGTWFSTHIDEDVLFIPANIYDL